VGRNHPRRVTAPARPWSEACRASTTDGPDSGRRRRSPREGLSIGRDSSDPVSHEYTGGFDFTGGKIHEVEVNIGDDVYVDIERDFAAAMARD
jgi:hypothetical protein